LLIQGSFGYTTERLRQLVVEKKPRKLIAVGDRVSKNIVKRGVRLDLAIIDNKVMRKFITPVKLETKKTYKISNPAGTLADEAWHVIREAVEYEGRVKVLVEGEEDLLTLVAVLSAPVGSLVVYGQPKKGIVVIDVTEAAKRKIREIVKRMEGKLSKD
jgi:uncharacterized protein (UPF0218 family)